MSKHAVQAGRLAKIGDTAVLGLAATLGLIMPSAAGAQTRGKKPYPARPAVPAGRDTPLPQGADQVGVDPGGRGDGTRLVGERA